MFIIKEKNVLSHYLRKYILDVEKLFSGPENLRVWSFRSLPILLDFAGFSDKLIRQIRRISSFS